MRKPTNFWTLCFLAAAGTGAGGSGPAKRPGPGEPAPDFQVAASDGRTVKLADFKGKRTVVLAFFPKAFTPG